LLKKYSVDYLYWDYNWIGLEYSFNSNGEIISWFDPLVIRYPEKYSNILDEYNISYFVQNTWLDPAVRRPDVKTMDLIFISPENYRNLATPWIEDLDNFLYPVWVYNHESNQTLSVIYKINNSHVEKILNSN
jgi:hypothetical protein